MSVKREILVTVPNRLHMFTTRAQFNVNNMTGGVGISVDTNQKMLVKISENSDQHKVPNKCIGYFCDLFKTRVEFPNYFEVNYENKLRPHCGYGTTVSQISALCVALNNLLGLPFTDVDLRKMIMENYCEQHGDQLIRGLETGVGPACSLYGGINMVVNTGSYIHMDLPKDIWVATFIPEHEAYRRSISLDEEIGQQSRSLQADEESLDERNALLYGKYIPAMLYQNWEVLGKLTQQIHSMGLKKIECERFDYMFQDRLIKKMLDSGALIAGLSSLGPLNYFLARENEIENIIAVLEKRGLATNVSRYPISAKGVCVIDGE